MALKTIEDFSIAGRKVFIRVDFNVAMGDGPDGTRVITDDTRLRAALETIEYARSKEAKIVLASHLGRPKGKPDPKYSLLPVAERLSELLKGDVLFPDHCVGDGPRKVVRDLKPGQVCLLENLRFHPGETANDQEFAQKLLEFTDVFIEDAFGAVHRAHASTDALPRMVAERGIGFLVRKELKYLGALLENAQHPFVAIIGGSKIADKISVIRQLIKRVDSLLICGGMAYTFLEARGFDIGKSLVEPEHLKLAKDIEELAKQAKVQLLLPEDHVVADEFKPNANTKVVINGGLHAPWMGLDIGPKTIEKYAAVIARAKTVFWNGPAGVFEMEAFRKGTLALAEAIAASGAVSVIGGGDSVAAISLLKLEDKMTHISTGGGATLEFLSGDPLPGLLSVET